MLISSSPDISNIDFAVLWDISGATPAITLTNQSTGAHLNLCNWWYIAKTPSGTYIHQGVATSYDMTGAWTTKVVTATNVWPQPFGQIEWSSIPYSVILYVKDSAGNIFSVEKQTVIIRPTGSDTKSKNNFGVAKPYLEVKCETGKIYAEDRTSYSWNGIAGVSTARTWTLVYPPDDTDTVPTPFVIADASNGLFPINFSAPGYQVILTTTMRYDYENDTSVKIKYKYRKEFTVACDIDLCPLICDFNQLLEDASVAGCSNKQDLDDKIRKINGKLTMALIGKMQPLCGINVGQLVDEIKEIGGFTCNCTFTGAGINGSSNSNEDLVVTIVSDGGDITGSATVTGPNVTIHLSDKTYIFAMCDDSDLKDVFTVNESLTGHTKTYCLNVDKDALIAAVIDAIPALGTACCSIYVPVHMVGTTTAPVLCPGSFYPARVYNYAATAVIGIAQSPAHMVSIINADSTWNIKGTAFVAGNCKVGFTPATGITAINPVKVDLLLTNGGGGGSPPPCVDNITTYLTPINDRCTGDPVAQLSFPADFFVQYVASGPYYNIGHAVDYADVITKLAAESHKPSNISYQAVIGNMNGQGGGINVLIYDINCAANNTITISQDYISEVGFGGNYNSAGGTHNGVYVEDLNDHVDLGKVCAMLPTGRYWQIVRMSNGSFIYACDTSSGNLYRINVALPLHPWVESVTALPTVPDVGSPPNAPFSGVPTVGGVASHYDVFFPSEDFSGTVLYILESTAGVLYKFDTATAAMESFYSIKLVGKCPRLVWNDKLYFTHDGTRETDAGINSTISRQAILILDLTNFAASGLSAVAVGIGSDEPWAMSRDKATGIAYITFKEGNMASFDLATDALTAGSPWFFGIWAVAFVKRVNTTIHDSIIYASGYTRGTKWVNLVSPSGSNSFDALLTPGANLLHHNFTPVPGKCYGILAYEKNGTTGGFARYTLDGKFLALNNLADGSIYNAIMIDPHAPTSPNTLC